MEAMFNICLGVFKEYKNHEQITILFHVVFYLVQSVSSYDLFSLNDFFVFVIFCRICNYFY